MAANLLSAKITVNGKGGHSSVPFKCHDPIVTAAEIINIITARLAYEFDSFDNFRFEPVEFNAGQKSNIIPDTADITYEGVFETKDEIEKTRKIVTDTAEKIASVNAGTVDIAFGE